MKRYQSFFEDNSSSQTTQRSNTEKSYIKAGKYIAINFPEVNDILDFGAGLGKGTIALQRETGKAVESYEPYAKGFTPDYHSFAQIDKQYDIVVNLNVLNVLPPDLRERVVKQIYKVLKPDGIAIIGTRGWNGDVASAKNFEPSEDEEKAIWVLTRGQRVYQKGFDGNELASYIKSIIPVQVKSMRNAFAKNSIIIHK